MQGAFAFFLGQILLYPLFLKKMKEWIFFVGKNVSLTRASIFYFALGVWFYLMLPSTLSIDHVWFIGLLMSLLISLSIIDRHTMYIPNIYPLLIALFGFGANLTGLHPIAHPLSVALCAITSYLLLTGANALFRYIKGADGLGQGDAKLFAALGCWFGWAGMLPIVIISNALFVGVAVASGYLSKRDVPIAFGPYLSIAGAVMALIYCVDSLRSAFAFYFF